MSTNFDVPVCPNSIEGQVRCARSDTFVEREKDDCFVIRCRTCRTVNIWPKEKDEKRGRYEAGLRKNMMEQQRIEAERRKKEYSFGG